MSQSPQLLLELLQRCSNLPNQIKQLHSLAITNGHLLHNPNSKWMNTLLYNSLIMAHLNIANPHKTLLLFTHMLAHQAPPNNYTFPSLIKAASSPPFLHSRFGESLHSQARKRGVSHDPFVQTSLIRLYAQLGHLLGARYVFDEISSPCIFSYNAMLDAFGRNGDMGSAVLLFARMQERDVYSWTSVINGFGKNGCFVEAIRFFAKMMRHVDVLHGLVKPNEATFVSVLSSCAGLDGSDAGYVGRQVHAYIINNQIDLTVFIRTALIAFYGKVGCLGIAMELFSVEGVRHVCIWNAMISSLASNGREHQALAMFQKMRMEGLSPNDVTFVAILTACARAKFVSLGLDLFQSMKSDFDIVARMEHYGCVVDLLGRAGLLKEASDFVNKMPFDPDASVLGALLGACKVHGAIALGNEVGSRLLALQPRHCGRYVVLSHIYAGADRWDHAAGMRKKMVRAGVQKIPAHSYL